MANNFTRLQTSSEVFKNAIKRFGITTVMNANVFDVETFAKAATGSTDKDFNAERDYFAKKTAYEIQEDIAKGLKKENKDTYGYRCYLDTLKTANVSLEGPSKTVTGGQYANPLIKFGKTATMEIQDALGNAEAIEALCGGLVEYTGSLGGDIIGLHNGTDFAGPKLIVGDSFIIDQKTGAQVKVTIIFYQFLPDSLFNLTQDAEGDATVFDMNGSLLTTNIQVGTQSGENVEHGVFYSILPALAEETEDTETD